MKNKKILLAVPDKIQLLEKGKLRDIGYRKNYHIPKFVQVGSTVYDSSESRVYNTLTNEKIFSEGDVPPAVFYYDEQNLGIARRDKLGKLEVYTFNINQKKSKKIFTTNLSKSASFYASVFNFESLDKENIVFPFLHFRLYSANIMNGNVRKNPYVDTVSAIIDMRKIKGQLYLGESAGKIHHIGQFEQETEYDFRDLVNRQNGYLTSFDVVGTNIFLGIQNREYGFRIVQCDKKTSKVIDEQSFREDYLKSMKVIENTDCT